MERAHAGRILSLTTSRFRNLVDGEKTFSPGTNLLVGPNGQGKTNLIEAIYCACFTKSFRTSHLLECAAHGSRGFRTACRIEWDPLPRTLEVRQEGQEKTTLSCGKAGGIRDFLETVSLLCITADHLRVITEGPDRRRRFFDGLLALFMPDFLDQLALYRRTLRQKNALLHLDKVPRSALEPWNRKLAIEARPLVEAREEFRLRLQDHSARDRFSGDELAVLYRPSMGMDLLRDEDAAVAFLDKHREQELAMRRSLYGPHLDRYEFLLGGHSVRRYASSGQKRGVLLSVYLSVLDRFERERGRFPVVMVDDVDLELDLGRIRTLLTLLEGRTQVFLTTAKPELFQDLLGGCTLFHVAEGHMTEDSPRSGDAG